VSPGIPCASCAAAGLDTDATTTSAHPDWAGYDLCLECAAEYDARPPVESGRRPAHPRDRRFIDWDEPGAVSITRAERQGPPPCPPERSAGG